MQTGRSAILIANPHAGGGRAVSVSESIASGLASHGWRVTTAPTSAAGDATRIAANECAAADLVVAIGGDGTLNEVVRGLLSAPGPRPTVGFVPAGTGNVAQRAFGCPRDTERALACLAGGFFREIDVGVVTRAGAPVGVFLLWLSAGPDAAFMHAFAKARQNAVRVAPWRLPGIGLRSFRRYAYPTLTVAIDDEPARGCVSGIVANVGHLAFAGNVAPNALPDDGTLDIVTIEDLPLLRWIPLAVRMLAGRLSAGRGVYATTGTRVSLRSASDVPIQIDGDPAGWLPADVTILPSAIRLVCDPASAT